MFIPCNESINEKLSYCIQIIFGGAYRFLRIHVGITLCPHRIQLRKCRVATLHPIPAMLTPTSQTFTGTIAYLRICLER